MIAVIIQARIGSNRFPRKIMRRVFGKTLIEHEILRVKKSHRLKKIILATTKNAEDDKLEEIAKCLKIDLYRGSENDVLDRYFEAAKKLSIDTIVRITGDCPLIDARIIDEVLSLFQKSGVDYASNVDPATYPDGMDVEVFSFATLEKTHKLAILPSDREHVTSFVRNHKNLFKQINLKNERDFSNLRITLDYPKDLETIKNIYKNLYIKNKYFGLNQILHLYNRKPNLFRENKYITKNLGYKKSVRKDVQWLQ